MLYPDFTAKLLEMKDVIVDSVVHHAATVEIHLHQQVKTCVCPACGKAECVVHDYRSQRIRDIPILGKQTLVFLRKRRYKCKHCGKQFAQPVSFLPRYYRMTNRLSALVIAKLAGVRSFTDIAKEVGLSVSTLLRIFDLVQYPKPAALPHVLAIDEFKGNTYSENISSVYKNSVKFNQSSFKKDLISFAHDRLNFTRRLNPELDFLGNFIHILCTYFGQRVLICRKDLNIVRLVIGHPIFDHFTS